MVAPCLTAIVLIKGDEKPLCLLLKQFITPGSQASEQHLVRLSVCLAELFAEGCACGRPLLEGSAMQGNAGGLEQQTELVGVADLPLRSRVTFGQFLDLSESQVPHLYKLAK